MAGFLGHAYQWRIFNRNLDRIRADYRFRIFHAKEFKHKTGDFDGWPDEKCQSLIESLADLANSDLTEGVTIHLERRRYLNEYRHLPFPGKMQPDSQYGLCFRTCLDHFLEIVAVRGGKHPKLHIVIEDGHKNVGGTCRIFNETKKRMALHGLDVLGTIAISQKNESKELMVADFLAHTYAMMRADPALLEYAPNQDPPNKRPRGKAGLTYLEFQAGALQGFKDVYEQHKKAEIEDWRAKRSIRKASSSQK
jgi:hypothetical protein